MVQKYRVFIIVIITTTFIVH